MAHSVVFAHKSKQVQAIHRQLVSDFQPAVKNIASAGQNFLRAYQNLSRNHYVYTASLYALAFSASSAEQEMVQQQQRKQLEQITEVMKTIHAEQNKTIEYFTKVMMTTNRNCEHEKERLKTMHSAFVKRERELAKAVDRGKKQPTELDQFYDQELAEMRDQQAQRYRFFVEKHLELLRHCLDWMHFSTTVLEREFNFAGSPEAGGGTESSGGVDEDDEKGHFLDELVEHAERMEQRIQQQQQQQSNNDGQMLEQHNEPKQKWKNAQNDVEEEFRQSQQKRGGNNNGDVIVDGANHLSQQQKQQQQHLLFERSNNNATRQQSRMISETTSGQQQQGQQQPSWQAQPATVPGLQRQHQHHLQLQQQQQRQGLFRPIPILPEQQQKYRHSLIEGTTTAGGGGPFGLAIAMNGRRMDELNELRERQKQQQMLMAEHQRRQQLQQYYSEGPPAQSTAQAGGGGGANGTHKTQQKQQQQRTTGSIADCVPGDEQQHYQQIPTRVHGQLSSQQQYRQQFAPASYRSSYALSSSPSSIANNQNHQQQQMLPPPVPQKPLSPLVTSSNINQAVQHVRGVSQESTTSSGMTPTTRWSRPFTPPIFVASDYGRLMECTTSYEAQGDNQLSLAIGEHVVLVKSGSRGWVLGRTDDGNRQGWFPAKYLKLI